MTTTCARNGVSSWESRVVGQPCAPPSGGAFPRLGVVVACERCTDRDALAERVIAAEARNRVYERAIREFQTVNGDDPNASLVALLVSRIEGLEANVTRLTSRKRAA